MPHLPTPRRTRLSHAVRRALFAGLLATSPLLFTPVALAQPVANEQTQTYAIPAGPLDQALNRFASEAGILLSVNAQLTADKRSLGLDGSYSIEEGLARLLAGTGLRAVSAGGNYALEVAVDGRDVLELGETTVTGMHLAATTEGTGSYTSRATAAATGLTLSPRETPQSVSVITRQRIDDQQMVTVGEILANSPGVVANQLDSERTTFSSRGFSITDIQYDGISSYYKSQYAAGESEIDSIIYDRIEIVRGATGLLTGAGEPSASINLVRKRADSREFRGQATLGAGFWDNYRATIDVANALTPDGRVRGRLVASYQDKQAFFDRYARESQSIYGVVDIDLTDATTLSVGASYQHSDAQGITYGGVPLWYTDGSSTHYSRSYTVAPDWNQEEVDQENLFVDLVHRLDNDWNLTLRYMQGRNKVDNSRLFVWGWPDPDTNEIADAPSRVRFPGVTKQESIDVRLSGPFSLLGREHEAIIGASHFDHRHDFDRIAASTAWTSPFDVDDFNSLPEPEWDWAAATLSERNHTKQSAVYGALRLSLADPLKFILGGRLTKYDREGEGYAGRSPYEYDGQHFIPYAGLVYDLTPNLSAYASYTSIFRNQDYRDRNGSWLDPVEGDAYETGLKAEFFDGRLNASVALFKIMQDKLGQSDTGYLVPGTTTQAYYAAEGAESKGVEFELSGELATGWNAFFFATHYTAKDADDNNLNTYLPRTMVRLFTTYQLQGDWNKLTIGGGGNWQSRIYYDEMGPNGERQEQSDYLLANLMARYQITPDLSAQFNVNNVFDKKYQAAVNWYGQGIWGTPRALQGSLTYKF